MASVSAARQEAAPIRACTVSRDVQNFDLLIEDMESELGECWGDLTFQDALKFLDKAQPGSLEFLAIALDDEDADEMLQVQAVIQRAKSLNIRIILIAEELTPIVLHQLLRLGADDFVPYPLPEGALHDAIERLRRPTPVLGAVNTHASPAVAGTHRGSIIAVQGLAGGSGSTTLAVNLAWELCMQGGANPPKVCLLDFDLQSGSVSTYLDLARTEKVYELLSNTSMMDREFFLSALQTFNTKLKVLTAPSDMLPLDIITPEDIERILSYAKANFDFVVIDMPHTVVQWTETVLHACDVYFSILELDMRSAQNALRLIRALKAEELPLEKMRFILNRAPKFTDLSGKARAKRMAESLDISLDVWLPDGAAQVTQANDHGLPLAEVASKNALLKEIRKLAQQIHEIHTSADKAAA
jgi:pilus assembly protein CpaE